MLALPVSGDVKGTVIGDNVEIEGNRGLPAVDRHVKNVIVLRYAVVLSQQLD